MNPSPSVSLPLAAVKLKDLHRLQPLTPGHCRRPKKRPHHLKTTPTTESKIFPLLNSTSQHDKQTCKYHNISYHYN